MGDAPKSYLPSKAAPSLLLWHWESEGWQKRYPALFQLLSLAQADGGPREGATLTLFTGEGRLKASLFDRHTEMTLWLTLEGQDDTLAEIDQLIRQGKGEWRKKREGYQRR